MDTFIKGVILVIFRRKMDRYDKFKQAVQQELLRLTESLLSQGDYEKTWRNQHERF